MGECRALLADLYNGALTYAEYAKRRQDTFAIANAAYEHERSRLVAEEAQAGAQDKQMRLQAVSAYLLSRPQPQPYIQLRSGPPRIDVYRHNY